jgi:lactoylglutathione lyase
MKIDHIAIWTKDLECVRLFDEKYFNPQKNFESYFLRFEDGARLKIKPEAVSFEKIMLNEFISLAHFAISVGSK